jgi:hypothetical protein
MKKTIRKILKENRVYRFLDYIVSKLQSETKIHTKLNRWDEYDVYIKFPWTTSERGSTWVDRTNLISFSASFMIYIERQYGIDFDDKLSKMIWDSYYSDLLKQVIKIEESAPGFEPLFPVNEGIIDSVGENKTAKKILQHVKDITEFDTEETKFKNYRKTFFRAPFTDHNWQRGVSKWVLETHFYDYLKSVFGFKINYVARLIYDEYYDWLRDTMSQLEDGYDEPDPNYISESSDKYVRFVNAVSDALMNTVKVLSYNEVDGDLYIRILNNIVDVDYEHDEVDGNSDMDFWLHDSLLESSAWATIHQKDMYASDGHICKFLERFGVTKEEEINLIWEHFRISLKEKFPKGINPLKKGSVNESTKNKIFFDYILDDVLNQTQYDASEVMGDVLVYANLYPFIGYTSEWYGLDNIDEMLLVLESRDRWDSFFNFYMFWGDIEQKYGVTNEEDAVKIFREYLIQVKSEIKKRIRNYPINESKDVAFGIVEELYDSVMGDLMNRTYVKQNNGSSVSVHLDGKEIFNNISKKRLKEKGDKISSPVFNNLCKIYNISNKNRDILWKRYISNILYNLNRS